ncbi:MAG: arylsulfatase [Verrucomicrobiota bacterium]
MIAILASILILNTAPASSPPNIVFILADDLGIGDVHCYNPDRSLIDTPNLDALAASGLRFTDAYVNASVCAPTRHAIMTGRYPWRFTRPESSGPWGFVGLRPNSRNFTIGQLLQHAGYKTGYVGKWHLGTLMTTTDDQPQGPDNVDYSQPLKIGTPQFGFDESFILPGSLDMYPYAFARNNVWQGSITAQKGWSAFNRIGPAEESFEDHEVLETFYRESEAFIKNQTADKPFFLFLALTAPHTPTSPGVNWQGKSELGVYGDFVMEVDHSVERVMNALKKKNLDQNTLVLFSSDHGAAPYAGNILEATPGQIHALEEQGHYPSGPHRGYKFSLYEGGLRVPLIAHWPAATPPNTTCNALVGLNDLMATFANITNTKLKPDQAPDSISFANLLHDPDATPTRTNLILQSAQECFVIRDGTWKLCLAPGSGAKGIHGNTPTPEEAWINALDAFHGTPARTDLTAPPFVQLFNLAEDPHEDQNLANQYPERIIQMLAILQNQIDTGRSTPGPPLQNDKEVKLHQRLPDFVKNQVK